MGSVAYKLALVAVGLADATWTLVPKHEWDVAGGVALVLAGGGSVGGRDGSALRFNQAREKIFRLCFERQWRRHGTFVHWNSPFLRPVRDRQAAFALMGCGQGSGQSRPESATDAMIRAS